MRLTTLFYTILISFLTFGAQAQTIFYVSTNGSSNGTALSWADANNDLAVTLQNAKNEANTSGQPVEVWVATGLYTPATCTTCSDSDRFIPFEIGKQVSLIGGFTGSETQRSQASPAVNQTILSGEIGASNSNDNSYNIVWCNDCGDQAEISGFTIENAYADRAAASGRSERGRSGAGIYLTGQVGQQANLLISNCVIRNNFAIGFGAAVYCNGGFSSGESSPIIREATIENNTTESDGGAIYATGAFGGMANLNIEDSQIINNSTNSGLNSCSGAGIYVQASQGTGNLTINRTSISNNNTFAGANTSSNGGAIYIQATNNASSLVNISNTIIQNNSAYSGGAVYFLGNVNSTFVNCTITGNEAQGIGGSGGALYNNASGSAGGFATNIINSILYDNRVTLNNGAATSNVMRNIEASINISYSVVDVADCTSLNSKPTPSDGSTVNCGAGMLYNQDPLFSAGTIAELQSTSPCINAGDNALAITIGGDLNSANRIQQGVVDLGATESSFAPLPVELLSFDAKTEDESIVLHWTTASEVNLAGYRLMRKNLAGGFDELVFIPAMGNGDYEYSDLAVLPGETYYYQIQSEDLDGTTYKSEITVARLETQEVSNLVSTIYPNPNRGNLKIEVPNRDNARTIYVAILNLNGQRVMFDALTTSGEHTLDLTNLPNGNYIVRLIEGNKTQTESLVIQY